jgi:outer membrane protein OmpA-like peptidoglycan-associated protein
MSKRIDRSCVAAMFLATIAGCAPGEVHPDRWPDVGQQARAARATVEQCYVAADTNDLLLVVDKNDPDQATNTAVVGNFNVSDIEAIAVDPTTDRLYGANIDQLGFLDFDTGNFTPMAQPFGSGTGALGALAFSDVDGLSFDPRSGELFGTVRRDAATDLLIMIDKRTGAALPGAFGPGVDYVEITGTNVDVDDIAIDIDGALYAITNNNGFDNRLVTIDKLTGVATDIGPNNVLELEGLGFDTTGQLWVSSGIEDENNDGIYPIDKLTGTVVEADLVPIDAGGDYEGITCLIADDRDGDGIGDIGEPILGTDPDDADTDDDGIADGAEPDFDRDTDGDGLVNARDPDSDNDGVRDGTETGVTTPLPDTDVSAGNFVPDANTNATTEPLDPDTDGGGVSDGAEDIDKNGSIDLGDLNPNTPNDDTPRADRDQDGRSDAEEQLAGSDPDDADTDDDGVLDGDEHNWNLDTDGDGLINVLDPDSDNEGLPDGLERGVATPHPDTDVSAGNFVPDADPATTTSQLVADTDNGGVSDFAEDPGRNGRIDPGERDPGNFFDDDPAPADGDEDGVTDAEEDRVGSDPDDADTDDDGVLDGAEHNWSFDTDGDGLINVLDPDSDNDGLVDGTERGVSAQARHPDTDVEPGNFVPDLDPTTTTFQLVPDTDRGGVPDGNEDTNKNGRADAGEIDPNDGTDDVAPADDDDDGLTNDEEDIIGSDPGDADSDDDGVLDGAEHNGHLDTDGDGAINVLDPDSDSDGILDGTERGVTTPHPDTDVAAGNFVPDADPTTTTFQLVPDTDSGGVPDGVEDTNRNGRIDAGERDPNDPADDGASVDDRDGDGLSNDEETAAGTDPDDADSDDDGLIDGTEPDWDEDTDGDGDINARDPDSDNDGILDGTELGVTDDERHPDTDTDAGNFVPDADPTTTTDPLDPDTDRGGVPDGVEDSNRNGRVDDGERDPNNAVDDGGATEGDRDGDGVPDDVDNCPDDANSDQRNDDGDRRGNACDSDPGFNDDWRITGGGCSAATGSADWAFVLGLAMLGLLLSRRARRSQVLERRPVCPTKRKRVVASRARRDEGAGLFPVTEEQRRHAKQIRVFAPEGKPVGALGLLVAAALGAGAGSARAQVAADFTLERFRIASDREGVLDVEWGGTLQRGQWDLGLWVGTQDDPLVVVLDMGDGNERVGRLVDHRVGGHFVATIGILDFLQAALEVPVILSQDQSIGSSPVGMSGDLSRVGLGDLRIIPKLGLLRAARHGVNLAIIPAASFPSSTSEDYFGDPGASFAPEIAVSRAFGAVRLATNIGYRTRKLVRIANLEVNDEIFGRIGAGYRFGDAGGPPLEVDLTLAAATRANDFLGDPSNNYVELHGAAQYLLARPVLGFVAGGVGLNEGFGAPDWRLLLGARFGAGKRAPARLVSDTDGDGLADDQDACPTEAENRNDFEDTDGCPDDPDSDGDGLADSKDACPQKPEDRDGFEDENGCPEPDNDGDGVADLTDECANEPEDVDAFKDEDGCPEPDNDGDAVLDPNDACVNEPGVVSNRGCPDPDRDGDTVADRLDNCPDEAGDPANQGCKQQQLVAIKDDKIELVDRVYFRTDRAIIQRRSLALLDNVATVLAAHPSVRVRIEGHTDDRGDAAYNKQLSQRRAEKVMSYLVGKGVDASRLQAIGYGEEQPLQDNDTEEGRAANRRVDFDIVGAEGKIEKQDSGPAEDTIKDTAGDTAEDKAGD